MSNTVATVDVAEYDDRALVLGQSEINTIVTFEEAIARAAAAAEVTTDELVTVASPWRAIDDMGGKDYLLSKPFFIVDASFNKDRETERWYVVLHIVTQANEMFYVTDGSTGIKDQMLSIIGQRKSDQHPTPFEGFTIANGLRKSEYQLVKIDGETRPAPRDWDGKIEGKATTYYLA